MNKNHWNNRLSKSNSFRKRKFPYIPGCKLTSYFINDSLEGWFEGSRMKKRGTPKYFPRSFRILLGLVGIFLENKMWIFSLLTFLPKLAQNESRTLIIMSTWDKEASNKRIKSSAKKMCDIGGPLLQSTIGFQTCWLTALLMPCTNLSMHNTNK